RGQDDRSEQDRQIYVSNVGPQVRRFADDGHEGMGDETGRREPRRRGQSPRHRARQARRRILRRRPVPRPQGLGQHRTQERWQLDAQGRRRRHGRDGQGQHRHHRGRGLQQSPAGSRPRIRETRVGQGHQHRTDRHLGSVRGLPQRDRHHQTRRHAHDRRQSPHAQQPPLRPMSRVAIHSDFDAVVDFFPLEQIPELVYGIVKFTYSLADGRVRRVEPVPLYHDLRDPNIEPKWSPGSDFWPLKTHTDVAVRGQAYAHATKTSARTIGIRVGEHRKNIAVSGDRVARWHGGRLRFEPPEPFESIPVVWSRAYGGCDPRVPVDTEPTTVATLARLEFDHPGMYPRNPFGCGYVVLPDPVPEIVLPNFEDPAHLLTPETLITAHPGRWYEQPLPACFEFTNAMMF